MFLILQLFSIVASVYLFQKKEQICKLDGGLKNYSIKGRLPDFIKPRQYKISFRFDKELTEYSGIVEIDISVTNRTDFIILHSAGNYIKSIDFEIYTKSYILISTIIDEICFIPERDFLVLKLKKVIEKGLNAKIVINFEGKVSQNHRGIFSTFITDNGLKK